MLHKTFHESILVGTALKPQTITAAAAVNGETIALNSGGTSVSFIAQTSSLATDEVATFKFEESVDGTTFTKIKDNDVPANDLSFAIPNADTGDEGSTIATIPFAKLASATKFVRCVVTSAGTTISYNIAVNYIVSGCNHPTATIDRTFAACVSFA